MGKLGRNGYTLDEMLGTRTGRSSEGRNTSRENEVGNINEMIEVIRCNGICKWPVKDNCNRSCETTSKYFWTK